MYILNRRIYASNDIILRMWIVAAFIILAVTAFLMWSDRFRESADTSISRISVFGVEAGGKEAVDFTGARGFFKKMNKLGLPAGTRKTELKALFEKLEETGTCVALPAPPILWIYAEGLTKEDRDRCVQTYGKVFFEKTKFCFSVVDASGFAIQLDPETFRVLWAKDGAAVCALPLLSLPENTGTRGFTLRIEERLADASWKTCGEIKIAAFPSPAVAPGEEDEPIENTLIAADTFAPQSVLPEAFTLPRTCRFFSAELWNREAFGELKIRIVGDAEGKVPAAAWSLENFGLFAPGNAPVQEFPITRADAFHQNVRFLESEIFENSENGVLNVPVAKTLFPAVKKNGEPQPWLLQMRLVRNRFFPEDFHAFPPMRVGKNSSVLGEPVSAKDSTVSVRAFRDFEYFRVRGKKIPAVVLEIDQTRALADGVSWTPDRVKTDIGEELFPESTVNVKPGVKQYRFLPRRSDLDKIEVVYAVTHCVLCEAEIVPEVREEK